MLRTFSYPESYNIILLWILEGDCLQPSLPPGTTTVYGKIIIHNKTIRYCCIINPSNKKLKNIIFCQFKKFSIKYFDPQCFKLIL